MFLGDLNAACSYVTNKGLKNVRLKNDPMFHWLIRDEQDTTVREKTRCAYDRSYFLSKPIHNNHIVTIECCRDDIIL